MDEKIVILGAGPCGLGAAWRLTEAGYENFSLYEKLPYAGGLAASFTDELGFTWDIGGHVQFSHYRYFDELMDSLLADEWFHHERESWVWIEDRFVPYPFQSNLRYLRPEDTWRCVKGLLDLQRDGTRPPRHFHDWILSSFGSGIADLFMFPYNRKVWAYDLRKLGHEWVGDRVARVDVEAVLENIVLGRDAVSWGPNNKFRYPQRGGTGEIWRRLYRRLDPGKVHLEMPAVAIDTVDREITFADGTTECYDRLISSIPLDTLLAIADVESPGRFLYSSCHIFGIGLAGRAPDRLATKCWMYFPEPTIPFYRATVLSNYSRFNVPDPDRFWSLMVEVAESDETPQDENRLPDQVVGGLLQARLIESADDVVDLWHHREQRGYPTPFLKRDQMLSVIRDLEASNIYSRGRFGAWKYEVSNQDHTLMQGVELVERLLVGQQEKTVWDPIAVNRR